MAAQARVLAGSAARPVAYVREHYVSSGATRDVAAALRAAEAEGCAGLILDARNNPGGVFEEAIAQARGAPDASSKRSCM
jgi:C-terminal processing protease CtpA/Prc